MHYPEELDCLPLRQVFSPLEEMGQTLPVAILAQNVDVARALLGLVKLYDGRVLGQLHVNDLVLYLLHQGFGVGLRLYLLEADDFEGAWDFP